VTSTEVLNSRRGAFHKGGLQYSYHRTACTFSLVSNLMFTRDAPAEKRDEVRFDNVLATTTTTADVDLFGLLAVNDQNIHKI
jgi:hypothetical protein